jgi:hypothetical protein
VVERLGRGGEAVQIKSAPRIPPAHPHYVELYLVEAYIVIVVVVVVVVTVAVVVVVVVEVVVDVFRDDI